MNRLLTSCFGLGRIPFAPGTWGSLPPVIIYMVLGYLTAGKILPAWLPAAAQAVVIVLASWVCVKFSPPVAAALGKKDPGEIVADEVAGQALVMFYLSLYGSLNICTTAAAGFLFFRLFDIAKPWPIRRLERLPQGWGILADDLMAAAYASALAAILILTLPNFFTT